MHRLDRDTSGLMVVAKTDLAHRRLGAALAARRVSRPTPRWPGGTWMPARSRSRRRRPASRRTGNAWRSLADGRAARTDALVVARFEVVDLLRLELHTGRTHQIRVHLEHIGHPVVGDPVYGGGGSRRISGPPGAPADRLAAAAPAPGSARCCSGIPPSRDRSTT